MLCTEIVCRMNTIRLVCANSPWRLISNDVTLHNVSKYQNLIYLVPKISKVVVKSNSLRTDRNDETSVRWLQFGEYWFSDGYSFLDYFSYLEQDLVLEYADPSFDQNICYHRHFRTRDIGYQFSLVDVTFLALIFFICLVFYDHFHFENHP